MTSDYPVRFDVDYPDRDLDRLSTGLRIFYVLPIFLLLALVNGTMGMGGVLFLGVLAMLLFRRKYPGWWFDWNVELTRFEARVGVYAALLRDEYPATDHAQAVHLEIDRPDPEELNRWLPLVKWLLALPHYIVLFILTIGAVLGIIVAWFAILFTGRYPRGIFDFIVGVHRWSLRVMGYAFLLVTDKYPPFSLDP
jgi:hypothetical protein